MTAYELMRAARDAAAAVERIENTVAQLRAAAEKATSHVSQAPGGRGGGDGQEGYIRLMDAKERLRAAQDAWRAALEAASLAIEALPEEAERQVMTLRYLRGMSWRQIMRAMHYSERGIFALHARALERMDERVQ